MAQSVTRLRTKCSCAAEPALEKSWKDGLCKKKVAKEGCSDKDRSLFREERRYSPTFLGAAALQLGSTVARKGAVVK